MLSRVFCIDTKVSDKIENDSELHSTFGSERDENAIPC